MIKYDLYLYDDCKVLKKFFHYNTLIFYNILGISLSLIQLIITNRKVKCEHKWRILAKF